MSSKMRTLQRRNLVFLAVTAALLAVVILRGEATVSAKKESLPLVFAEFEPDDARRVEIRVEGEDDDTEARKVTLEMGDGGRWHLASHHDYPLQAGADRLLDAVARARRGAIVTRRTDTFEQYAGIDGWTQVTILDSRARTLVSFALGKYQYPETFLRASTGDTEQIVKATNIVPNAASTDAKSWIDTRIWPNLTASKLLRIDVEQRRDERTITIAKRGASAADVEMAVPEIPKKDGEKDGEEKGDEESEKVYWMASPEEGDAKKVAVEDLAREFTGILIEDVVAGALTPEDEKRFGLDDPELVVTFYQEEDEDKPASKHVLEVGKKAEDDGGWYVRRRGAQWVFRVRASSVSRMRQTPGDFVVKPEPEPTSGDGKDEGGK